MGSGFWEFRVCAPENFIRGPKRVSGIGVELGVTQGSCRGYVSIIEPHCQGVLLNS